MESTLMPDSIFAHPALAGRTLLVRQGQRWADHAIRSDGTTSMIRQRGQLPAELAWRGDSIG